MRDRVDGGPRCFSFERSSSACLARGLRPDPGDGAEAHAVDAWRRCWALGGRGASGKQPFFGLSLLLFAIAETERERAAAAYSPRRRASCREKALIMQPTVHAGSHTLAWLRDTHAHSLGISIVNQPAPALVHNQTNRSSSA